MVVTEQGLAIKTRAANIRRVPESERWDADRTHGMRAVPWSPDGSDNTFDTQVGAEGPAEIAPPLSWRSADAEHNGEGVPSNGGVSAQCALGADT